MTDGKRYSAYGQFESASVESLDDIIGGIQWIIEDSSGNLRCDDLNDYMYFPQVGDSLISIKGILFYSYGDFKLEPRFTNDISAPPIEYVDVSMPNSSYSPSNASAKINRLALQKKTLDAKCCIFFLSFCRFR